MTRRIQLLFTLGLLVFSLGTAIAQDKNEWGEPKMPDNFATEETASNKDKTSKWKSGDSKYYSKPKNMWEVGIGVGHFFIDGDVDPTPANGSGTFPAGWGVSLHLRKAINYIFSLRGELLYGRATGLDPQLTDKETALKDLPELTGKLTTLHRNFKETHISGDMQIVVNVGNLLFHKERNKWNWHAFAGLGLNHNKTEINALNASGNGYTYTGLDYTKLDTKAGRKDIKAALRDQMDDTYETEAFKKKAIFRLGDDTNIHPEFTFGTGISYRLNRRVNIGLEHKVYFQDNDQLDGFTYRSAVDQSNQEDIPHYTSLRFNFNLGNFDKAVEPLYWLNPLDAQLNDIAELKKRPLLNLDDADKDGVIDMLDAEKDTPSGCPVDTRGVTLDSDNDGVADCKDKEPYSPPGYKVDRDGVADVPAPPKPRTDSEIIDIVKRTGCCDKPTVVSSPTVVQNTEWLLPMAHYDLNKCDIKPDAAADMYQVAEIMKKYPNICVAVEGHADGNERGGDVLAYHRAQAAADYLANNYGIDRSRLAVKYGMGSILPGSNYINRRVEFKVGSCGEGSMGAPAGAENGGCGVVKGGSVSKKAY